jgi:ATP-dependent RNA helicase DOB1
MYNSITEEKIKNIPEIGEIDLDRLPQMLTQIYAQIVSLRRQFVDGTLDLQDSSITEGVILLRTLATNLETIILIFPFHEQKESIAFVAGTANSLLFKILPRDEEYKNLLEVDAVSSYLAACVLYLIGNSQADAAEMANSIQFTNIENPIQKSLVQSIKYLAIGDLQSILELSFHEELTNENDDLFQTAINYLWREIGIGVVTISKKLLGQKIDEAQNHFEKVIELSKSESGIFEQKSIFAGPLRLAKLLNILDRDLLSRGVINIPTPVNIDAERWKSFLANLASFRPYLWENHKDAVETNFLNPGISAVLTLPTGAGKSTLAELKIASCLISGRKVIYLVPTHALEDQIKKSLKDLFQEYESINVEFDGEFSDFDAKYTSPILVMTPERCLTLINLNNGYLEDIGLIVFDEFHLIHGTDIKKDRRSIDAMYCLLSLFNEFPHSDYLLISAMVKNGDEISDWVADVTGRECKVFNSNWKPTRQLIGCLVYNKDEINKLNTFLIKEKRVKVTKFPNKEIKNEVVAVPECFFSMKNIWETSDEYDYFRTRILGHPVRLGINNNWSLTSNRNEVASQLGIHFANLGLKTLIFVDNPSLTISTANKVKTEFSTTNIYKSFCAKNKNKINNLISELGSFEFSYFYDGDNVGVHHGLLLPIERLLIEEYYKIKGNGSSVLIATATLAQGINLPAEIVIIAGDDRFDEDSESRERVEPHELLNAAGRAGRAGLSSQGAVILIPGDIVTIEEYKISRKWWQLKEEVFSQGDQCLVIEDPLQYFLDSIQENLQDMSSDQKNILFRLKPDRISENETKQLFIKSFYHFQTLRAGDSEKFNTQLNKMLFRRNELDEIAEDLMWQKEISVKFGIDPYIIKELVLGIEKDGLESFFSKSIPEIILWYINWFGTSENYLSKIFTKVSTINEIKRCVGLKPETTSISDVLPNIYILSEILLYYVLGMPLNKLNEIIPNVSNPDNSGYLIKARKFINRLVPELSFGFGILSYVLIELANQKGLDKKNIPNHIKLLASCIREGFDTPEKLFFKMNKGLEMRIETHELFKE